MFTQSLNGTWQFRQAQSADWLPATVPGGVHTDLLAAGRIPDPFVGDHEKRVQWVAESDWTYCRIFTPDQALLTHDRVDLVCDGLDTLAEVRLNGQLLGQTDNMFRRYRWDVKPLLNEGENELTLQFRSPVAYVTACERSRSLPGVGGFSIAGGSYLRKAPYHFGWDWGPILPALGVWRDVRLEAFSTARLGDIHLRQRHVDNRVTLTARVQTEVWGGAPLRVVLRLTAPNGEVQRVESSLPSLLSREGRAGEDLALDVIDPQLWYSNGLGPQSLYRVEVALLSGDVPLDTRTYSIGLRTIELRQQPDEWGRSFTFVVNGIPVFAKGANWIPADSFPTRTSRARLEQLLRSAAEAHHNMIRVWGGGYYEDENFYDLCDRYGLLVWQDFMFACAGYPMGDADFLANLQAEALETVRRLRHRACLALWCGNNEMEGGWAHWGWSRAENEDLKAAYDRFFHHLLPDWVQAEDPDTAYWPSSPSSGVPFDDPNGRTQGDVHQWEVWHALKPFSHYRETPARFVSEFGFQSLPALATVAAYAEPSEWNMTSYVMEHHQRNLGGNGKIITYLTQHFKLPKDFASLVYLTQVLQAEAMRTGVEHWRGHPACSGALYWQLNDCWPVASWSSLDYYGRWKALHYASRRFYAPVLLSIEDDGDRMKVFISNDTLSVWTGEVRWSWETLNGEVLDSGVETVSAAPLTATAVCALDFGARLTHEQRRTTVFVCERRQGDECVQRALAAFAPDKHLALTDPGLHVETRLEGSQLVIDVCAQTLARFVELAFDDADVIFSDNYFDLPAGRSVTLSCAAPADWTLDRARQHLRVRSLFDSF